MEKEYCEEVDIYSEEEESDLVIEDLEVFNDVVIWGTDWTTETVVTQLKKGNIDLKPKFQRRDAWNQVDKSKLIESLFLGLPVPPIILAEKKDQKGKYIVIDGKQRLLTLRQFCAPDNDFNTLKLRGLQLLKTLNGKVYADLQNYIEYSKYVTQFENQSIRAVVIKNWPNERFLYTVFLRLNTGSKKLSSQELRQALHPGDFLDFLDEQTSKSQMFLKLLNNKVADSRMRDVELALRFFAFKHHFESFDGNLKEFLDNTCNSLNKSWNKMSEKIEVDFKDLEEAINFTFEVFGEKEAFSRWINDRFNSIFNRALYEVFSYYFSIPEVRIKLSDKKEEFKSEFIKLCKQDVRFNDSISSTTKDVNRTEYRFSQVYGIIKELTSLEIPKIERKAGKFVVF